MFNLFALMFLLVSSIFIVVLVLYAIDRIKRIEDVAAALMQVEPEEAAKKPRDGPFAGYQGKELWDIMTGKEGDKLSSEDIAAERQRFTAVLEKAVKLVFENGRSDGQSGNPKEIPKNERMVKTLRGSVMSWLPSREVSTIYNTAYDSARANPDDQPRLEANLKDSLQSIFRQADLDIPASLTRLMQSREQDADNDQLTSEQRILPEPVQEEDPGRIDSE